MVELEITVLSRIKQTSIMFSLIKQILQLAELVLSCVYAFSWKAVVEHEGKQWRGGGNNVVMKR